MERLLITTILLIVGALAYQSYRRTQLQRAAKNAVHDPLLAGLQLTIPTVVYFTTPHCIPCRLTQQPALEHLQSELQGNLQVIRIDATQDPQTANRWGVMTAPTTFILDQTGAPRAVNHGAASALKLKQQINTVHAISA